MVVRARTLAFVIATVLAPWPGAGWANEEPPLPSDPVLAGAAVACPDEPSVVVRSESAADAQAACDGARRALAFLTRSGLATPPQTSIEIVEHLPGDLNGRAVGCYLRDSRRVLLLTYASFAAGGTWFRVPADAELYRAAASHEVAHAAVACGAEPARPPLAVHEYVAYVVMFETMDPALRAPCWPAFPARGSPTRCRSTPWCTWSTPRASPSMPGATT